MAAQCGEHRRGPVVIFDCNGVLVDSEPIAAAVLAEALRRIGLAISAETVMRRFHGRRPADIFAAVETAAGRKLPADFPAAVAAETLRRLRAELRPIPHAAHALTWLRGPKAVASSSSLDRIRLSLEVTGLMRFFEPRLFSASDVRQRQAGARSFPAGGRAQSGCAGGLHRGRGFCAWRRRGGGGGHDADRLRRRQPDARAGSPPISLAAGARTVIADMRALKSTITDLRGW